MPKIIFPCIEIAQPIGSFYVGVMDSRDLCDISYADVRRIEKEKRDVESYLGIQRPLQQKRVSEIREYVKTGDACFPTSIILAIESKYASYAKNIMTMTLSVDDQESPEKNWIAKSNIAKVLDGQHRIEGLRGIKNRSFKINVSIFIDMDIEEQAYIFSMVNLTQTKVNKSLAYDLLEYASAPSPQKLCHDIAVFLDSEEGSPFFKKIKRLGVATEGRFGETITQATFAQSLISYLTKDNNSAISDRDLYRRGEKPEIANANESEKLIFRNMMIEEQDDKIADILWNYFAAVRKRWPTAWESIGEEYMLNKTNGFKACMRFLQFAYRKKRKSVGDVVTENDFYDIFHKIKLNDKEFNIDKFKPGSSGESALFNKLMDDSNFREIFQNK